jgi:glycosyltransferase involved in cell wall biosynthesis
LGRISWKKRLDRLLGAFALTDVGSLAIIGPDDEKLVPTLRQLAAKLGIAHRVRILGRSVSGSDKEECFSAARVFVLWSISENFGNTLLEAMQRGIPVITGAEVGAADIVRTAGGGIVTEGEGDVTHLAEALRRLVADPPLCRVLGTAGQRYVSKHCGWPESAIQMEALYEGLSSRCRGRARLQLQKTTHIGPSHSKSDKS